MVMLLVIGMYFIILILVWCRCWVLVGLLLSSCICDMFRFCSIVVVLL